MANVGAKLTIPFTEPEEVAWAAGLFEGEGSIVLGADTKSPSGRPQIRLTVVSTDRDVLERFETIVGRGKVYERTTPAKAHWKPQFSWMVTDADGVQAVMNLIGPWLGERRLARWNEAWQRWVEWNEEQYERKATCPVCGGAFRLPSRGYKVYCFVRCRTKAKNARWLGRW